MFGHLVVFFFDMAGDAIQARLGKLFLAVTAMAFHYAIRIIFLMTGQAKTCHKFVVDVLDGKSGDISVAPLVFDMTCLASFYIREVAVQAVCRKALFCNLQMAILAFGIGYTVQRGMAVAAFLFEIGMGCEFRHLPDTGYTHFGFSGLGGR